VRIFYLILFGIILASCSRTGDTSLVPASVPNGGASSLNAPLGTEPSFARQSSGSYVYKLLYAFDKSGGAHGSYPGAGLTDMAGQLYGTTELGGGTPCISDLGCGTVFKVSRSGRESVVYRFKGSPDGSAPTASLIVMNGALYGTTTEGGAGSGCNTPSGNCGTVFKVTASGTESVLHTFTGGADGSEPWGPLVAVNGTLYGTTLGGGGATGYGYGTVFSLTASGQETVLHSFGNVPDGAYPYAGLIALHGALYGTTFQGGTNAGTVFKVSMSGDEHVIYSFLDNNVDGQSPQAGLIAVKGKLYGTTIAGGANDIGTVFEASTSGHESVLYSFAGSTGGAPIDALIAMKDALYGTTSFGGPNICVQSQNDGCGTVFKLSMSGTETVLHNFGVTPDGSDPGGSLLAVNGALYGTTEKGGPPNIKHGGTNLGSVFKVSP